ncbi:hypothetical protein ACQKH5_13640 [Hyphomonas sp. NPDC076900]|uniref:hypothetical protein n=1 Tax=unclassified Hyphomonas TaxID=2630699 RepID=UPI003CFC8AED
MPAWSLYHRTVSNDGRRAVAFFVDKQGHARFVHERWQKYYGPSPADENEPVVGGLWPSDFESGLYATLAEAEKEAQEIIDWYSQAAAR